MRSMPRSLSQICVFSAVSSQLRTRMANGAVALFLSRAAREAGHPEQAHPPSLAGDGLSLLTRVKAADSYSSTLPDKIGIGAAVTHRPLPHHPAYGSVQGGSRTEAITRRAMTEAQAI